ncbi:DNA polymerase III subunit beta [Paenarthrobacter sp. TA1.8]|uniref:DNA polymerase III subunit beta n=1 Tax=Paenarthrobacter sp. TA1.8 TaxID=3400219 RepID=UPI003B432617
MTITATKPITNTEPALADLEITATGTEWLRRLAAVGVAVSSRPPVPVLGFVLLECSRGKATITGYDYSTSAVVKMNHETVGALRNAKALVPLSWLARTIRVLTTRKRDVPVTVASKEMLGRMLVTVTAAGFTIPLLHGMPITEYPALPEHAELDTFTLDREDLAAALDRASIAASKDDTLPILTSIELDCSGKSLTLQATDRYRLSSETLKLPRTVQEFNFLLPATAWKAMAKHLAGDKITVGVLVSGDVAGRSGGSSTIYLATEDCTYTLSGVGGDYPKIKSLFEQHYSQTLDVNRRDLMDQVLVARELNERNLPALVKIGPGSVTVSPTFDEGADQATTPVLLADTTNIDEQVTVAYNPHYLLDALTVIKAEVVRFSFFSLPKPVCISPVNEKGKKQGTYRHLIMPVRMPSTLGGE